MIKDPSCTETSTLAIPHLMANISMCYLVHIGARENALVATIGCNIMYCSKIIIPSFSSNYYSHITVLFFPKKLS